MKLLIIISLFIGSISFANRESGGGNRGASAVFVDFRSPGTGIDIESEKTYKVLAEAAKSRGEVIDETVTAQGREGEIRYCIHFTNANQRNNFIQSLAFSILNDRQKTGFKRTAVYVGMNCNDFDSATEQELYMH